MLGLIFLTSGSQNAAKNNERCWNIRWLYAHMETYIWGFAGHDAGMNGSNKDVYHDQYNNSNIHSIKNARSTQEQHWRVILL